MEQKEKVSPTTLQANPSQYLLTEGKDSDNQGVMQGNADIISNAIAKAFHDGSSMPDLAHIDVTSPDVAMAIQNEIKRRTPTPVEGIKIQNITDCINEAKELPPVQPIIPDLINEENVCILAGASGIGKSCWMFQKSIEIAKKYRLAYFDAELSQRQLLMRYPSMKFPPTFFRIEKDRDTMVADDLLTLIERAVIVNQIKILVIDNITSIATQVEKSSDATTLMGRLVDMKKRYNLTLIVLAHIPKMYAGFQPITLQSVAGSSKITDLSDNTIGLAQSARDNNQIYLKQLKYRDGQRCYEADNCIVYERGNDAGGNFTLTHCGYAEEKYLLSSQTEDERRDLINQVKNLASKGFSSRRIAAELGISKATANRYLKK